MQLILTQNLANLGSVGEIVNVRDGYGRNFLLPRGFAVLANSKNKALLDHQVKVLEKKRATLLNQAKKIASDIEKVSVTVNKQVGEDEKIFGSVTTAELEELLNNEGIKVSKKDIHILDEIKKVGVYSAEVRLHPDISAKFKVWVVAQ